MKYILLLLFIFPGLASACSFAPDADIFKPHGEVVGNYEYAFVGYIGPRAESAESELSLDQKTTYTLSVDRVYKGDLKVSGDYILYSENHSCGFFHPGKTWGVFLMNEIGEIAEWTPKYLSSTKSEVLAYAEEQFLNTEESSDDQAYEEPEVPNNCELWNDGCNSCGVEKGQLTFCTKMACLQKGEPFCIEYTEDILDESDIDALSVGPQFEPTVGFVEPTTPPPYDNNPEKNQIEATVDKKTFWQKIIGFFSSLIYII